VLKKAVIPSGRMGMPEETGRTPKAWGTVPGFGQSAKKRMKPEEEKPPRGR